MKRIAFPLLAGLMALAACTNDTLQELAPATPGDDTAAADGVPEGSFIVDYTVDGGPSTRADSKLQVQTLDYYVYYSKTDTLVKKRRIEIEENQEFPLTRETMTWEQRQALQDTLDCGEKYRILFLANVDPALFAYDGYSNEEGGTPHPAIVINDERYSTARLLLPNVPFHEDNMYCLWEGELSCATDAADKVVKRENVLLQRVVTRTDIKRTDSPTTLYDAIANGFYKDNCETNVTNGVSTWIDNFQKRIEDCAGTYHVKQNINQIHEHEDDIKEFTRILVSHKQDINNYIKEKLIADYSEQLTGLYNTSSQTWGNVTNAQINYDNGQRVNAIGFNLTGYSYDSRPNTAPCSITEDYKLRFYGFEGTTDDVKNTFSAVDFYTSNSTDITFTLTGASFSANQGRNTHLDITCDPVAFIKCKEGMPASNSIRLYDLTEILKDKEDWKAFLNNNGNNEIITIINYFFTECAQNHAGEFENDSYSLSSFPIQFNIPDLSATDAFNYIELVTSWK